MPPRPSAQMESTKVGSRIATAIAQLTRNAATQRPKLISRTWRMSGSSMGFDGSRPSEASAFHAAASGTSRWRAAPNRTNLPPGRQGGGENHGHAGHRYGRRRGARDVPVLRGHGGSAGLGGLRAEAAPGD